MAIGRSAYLMLQNKLQPHLKDLYARVREVLPPSLILSARALEAKRYLELAEIDDESDGTIKAIQGALLARTLQNAIRNVPFYMERVQVDPGSINPGNATEKLLEFPLIDKQEITRDPSRFVSRRVNRYALIYTTSGGSTGRGITLYRRHDEYQVEQAFIENMWGKLGYGIRSRVLRMGADGIAPIGGPPCQIRHRRLLVSPRHLTEKWLPEIVERVDEFRPEFIYSYPSCLEVLAGYLREKNRGLEVKGIFLASEEVTPAQLDFFREVLGAPLCYYYGAAEHTLLGLGCFDGQTAGYHFSPIYGFAENLKDDYGYELVGTGLWNDAMPLIRYRTQDYGEMVGGLGRCGVCGRAWKTVRELDGRRQNYLTTKQGTRFPGLSVWVDKFIWDHVSTFQFVQNRPGALELHVTPRRTLTSEVEARILQAQREKLSDWFEPITLVKDEAIPRTSAGKRRLVVVNVGPDEARPAR